MIYVDTSIIVRYLTGDDPERSPAAAAVIETEDSRAMSIVSIVEAAHLLRSAYHHERGSIASALIGLVERGNVVIPEFPKEHILRWLDAWRNGAADSIGTRSSRPACPPTRPKPWSHSTAGSRQANGPS